jgi:hypothetical protein
MASGHQKAPEVTSPSGASDLAPRAFLSYTNWATGISLSITERS